MFRTAGLTGMSLLILLCACAAVAGTIENMLKTGNSLWENKDYDAALQIFTKVIEIDPTCADGYYGRGMAQTARGAHDAAIRDLTEAIHRNPTMSRAYRNRGMAYFETNQMEKAISDLSEAIRLDPKDAVAYCNRSAVYSARGDYDSAIADSSEAIRLDSDYAGAYNNRAGAYYRKSEYDRAIADASEAIRLAPGESSEYRNRSAAYASKGDYARAITDLTRAIEIDPKSAHAWIDRGRAYATIGKLDEAIQDCRRAIELDPECTKYHVDLAGFYVAARDWDKALAEANEATRLSPESALAYWQRGGIQVSRDEDDLAIQDFTTAIRLDPSNACIHLSRGACHRRREEYEKAVADFDAAIRLDPHSPCGYEQRGALWIERGDCDRGMADIETCIRLNPGDPARSFGTDADAPVDATALAHGERQVRQMLEDRPVMAQYGQGARVLYVWAARMFAREDLHQTLFWDRSEPPAGFDAMSHVCTASAPGFIRVRREYEHGLHKSGDRPFEVMWRDAVFELYNVGNGEGFRQLETQATGGELSKSEFVVKTIECESRAAESTRAFYIRVFLPWAKAHNVPTHPAGWFVAWRSEPNEPLLRGRYTETPYWRHYERSYEFLSLHSLVAGGKYQEALDLTENLPKDSFTQEEQIAVGRYAGYCLVQLDRPVAAIDAYSQVIRLDPTDVDAYQGRAAAYAATHEMDRAIADCSEVIRLRPASADAYIFRGRMYEWFGDKSHAQSDFATARLQMELWGQPSRGNENGTGPIK